MCGLVGTFGFNLIKTDIDQFGFLLNIDVIRGYDSTGVAVAREKGKAKIIKGTFLPPDLLSLESYKKITQYEHTNSITALIGHNRAATRGKVEQKNAHPFSYGHITLVHNGTANLLPTLALEDKEFTVDSEAICYGIWKHGIDKVYAAVDGALTVVWWDNSEKALYHLTNGQRPFSLC